MALYVCHLSAHKFELFPNRGALVDKRNQMTLLLIELICRRNYTTHVGGQATIKKLSMNDSFHDNFKIFSHRKNVAWKFAA